MCVRVRVRAYLAEPLLTLLYVLILLFQYYTLLSSHSAQMVAVGRRMYPGLQLDGVAVRPEALPLRGVRLPCVQLDAAGERGGAWEGGGGFDLWTHVSPSSTTLGQGIPLSARPLFHCHFVSIPVIGPHRLLPARASAVPTAAMETRQSPALTWAWSPTWGMGRATV